MAGARTTKRLSKAEQARSDLLDGFFASLLNPNRGKLLSSVCEGVVTGAALADRHRWRREEVSRQVDVLERGGLLEARRAGRWVRFTPTLRGLLAAKAWVGALRADDPSSLPPPRSPHDNLWRLRTPALTNRGRRSLLAQIRLQEGATQIELRRACGLSQSLASRGLAQLQACGLVAVRHETGRPRYSADFEQVEKLWTWLGEKEAKLITGRSVASAVVLHDPRTSSSPVAHEPVTGLAAPVGEVAPP